MSGHCFSPELCRGQHQKVEMRLAPMLEQKQECFISFLSVHLLESQRIKCLWQQESNVNQSKIIYNLYELEKRNSFGKFLRIQGSWVKGARGSYF